MADERQVAVCPECLTPQRTTIPAGGDGSAEVFYRHNDGSFSRCPGSRTLVEQADYERVAGTGRDSGECVECDARLPAPEPPAQPAPLFRLPLTITVTATGTETKGVLCGVMAADLDSLESERARLAAALEAAEGRIALLSSMVDPDVAVARGLVSADEVWAEITGTGEREAADELSRLGQELGLPD